MLTRITKLIPDRATEAALEFTWEEQDTQFDQAWCLSSDNINDVRRAMFL